MEKVIVAIVTAILCSIFSSKAQESDLTWGIKGGANYATLWDRVEMDGPPGINYQYKAGFFVGGFVNILLSERFKFQPELSFSHRESGIDIIGFNRPVLYSDRYKATRIESVIDLPAIFRYRAFNRVFLEAGPQLGFLIKQEEEMEESPFGTEDINFEEYDKVDAGLAAGVGVNFSSRLAINARYFQGLIKRDNSVNSSVLNIGMEYTF